MKREDKMKGIKAFQLNELSFAKREKKHLPYKNNL